MADASPTPAMPPPSTPAWVAPLAATLLMQAVASGLCQTLPVIAPLLTAEAGLAPESIGPLTAVTAAGTVLFLLFGGAILARFGPVRALQIGTSIALAGLLLTGFGTKLALLAASLLLGIGYGPTPPAGSRILAATVPPRHRTLIFSVKQAGAPLGGSLAGLLAAPVAAAWGWLAAVLLAAAVAAVALLAIQPVRARLDAERERSRAVSPAALFGRGNLAAPFRALRADRMLLPLSLLGLAFAVTQGCLFTFCVSWLVETHGLGLVAAGSVFAVLQGTGIFARILLGWLADRTGQAARNLAWQAYAAALCVVALVLLPADAGMPWLMLLAVLNGGLCASWNGIVMAEIARLAPPEHISDATSGSTLLVFCGYIAGPAGFYALVRASGGWDWPFLLVAAQLALAAGLMGVLLRRPARSRHAGSRA
ncbi:MFS transporter [Siccirubricoccus sp. KC 17139]|uniref:MFS transporter n=1 Tax=Siccirubricoccus soli TaxID=2899147 RepID=A0ABT1DB91_9PROT|nr:MFS transporter [Siccirubricoccus soli]MCO6418495.1 MFS transporter [Siccirubricoccus soli]MCP2684630.1 MFS transporter [Siccirubricoccus soli]